MNNKKLNNSISYREESMKGDEQMNNKKFNNFYEELAESDRLYKGLISNNLIYIEQVILNNRFLYNQIESKYLKYFDRQLSQSQWYNLKDDMVQDLIYKILEYKIESESITKNYTIEFISFKKLLNLVGQVIKLNLKHWTREVNLSGLESESLDIYNVLVYEEEDINNILTNKKAVEELCKVVTPTQKKYIKEYIIKDGCYQVNMVKDRILKAAKRSPMLKELYNI